MSKPIYVYVYSSLGDHSPPVCSMVFWIGDLNYRLQRSSTMTSKLIRNCAEKYQIKFLQEIDQVRTYYPLLYVTRTTV